MRRLMRDAEQREFVALEKADLERRRLMTDEQRINEDKRLGKCICSIILYLDLLKWTYFLVECLF